MTALNDILRGDGTVMQVSMAKERVESVADLAVDNALLGSDVVLAYGRHLAVGKSIFEYAAALNDTRMLRALGEGEWDANETLWINGLLVDPTDTNKVHFHPGLDGQAGIETSPGTRNQKLCSFLPPTWYGMSTYSRTAYLALKLGDDLTAPNADFSVLGVFRCLRVRDFDNTGAQTGYGYSTNPERILLDLLIRRWIKVHGTINETLTSGDKLKADFAGLKTWADACDVSVGGVARWQAHLAFTRQEPLIEALERVALAGRAYWQNKDGKVRLFHDEARAPLMTLTMDDILDGTLELPEKDLRPLPNRFFLHYRSLDSGRLLGTISTTGTAVTGVGTLFTQQLQVGMVITPLEGAQAGEGRTVFSIASDTSAVLATAFSADQAGKAYGTIDVDFQERTRAFDNETMQDQVGKIVLASAPIELGNNTDARIERLGKYLLGRNAREKQVTLAIGNDRPAGLDLMPGDEIVAPDAFDYLTTSEFEIQEMAINPDLSISLLAEKQDDSIFTDVSGAQQPAVPPLVPSHRVIQSAALASPYTESNAGVQTVTTVSSSTIPTGGSAQAGSLTFRVGKFQQTMRVGVGATHPVGADGTADAWYIVKLAGQADITSAHVQVAQGTGNANAGIQVALTAAHAGKEVTIEIWGSNTHTNSTSTASGGFTGYPTVRPQDL